VLRPVEALGGELAAWKGQLLNLVEAEKPYLEVELSLPDLARRLQMPVPLLSQVINEGTGKNFNDFINAYRVAEFLRQAQRAGQRPPEPAGHRPQQWLQLQVHLQPGL
jgi:AraC-like DNA-binding protein